MPFKSIFRELRGKKGLENKQKKLSEAKCVQGQTKSHITTEGSLPSQYALVQESLWANLPSELLLDIFGRVEENETTWPGRRAVVACAGVCRSWREVAKEVVKTPEECGLLTFPISLKQPGPRDSPIQCFIRRERATSTYQLYLGLSPALAGDPSKFNNHVGKLRSNFFGSKFVIHDCQPPSNSAIQSHGWSRKKVSMKKVSPRLPVCNYNVATISYELNVLRTRGPRRMQCNMHAIPVSAIQEGGSAPTPATFTNGLDEMFSPLTASTEKNQKSTFTNSVKLPASICNTRDPLVLRNKIPRWHEQLQCWCLNFRGRVTVASVKNFQLVASVDTSKNVPASEQEKETLKVLSLVPRLGFWQCDNWNQMIKTSIVLFAPSLADNTATMTLRLFRIFCVRITRFQKKTSEASSSDNGFIGFAFDSTRGFVSPSMLEESNLCVAPAISGPWASVDIVAAPRSDDLEGSASISLCFVLVSNAGNVRPDGRGNEVVRPFGVSRGSENPCEMEARAWLVIEALHEMEMKAEEVIVILLLYERVMPAVMGHEVEWLHELVMSKWSGERFSGGCLCSHLSFSSRWSCGDGVGGRVGFLSSRWSFSTVGGVVGVVVWPVELVSAAGGGVVGVVVWPVELVSAAGGVLEEGGVVVFAVLRLADVRREAGLIMQGLMRAVRSCHEPLHHKHLGCSHTGSKTELTKVLSHHGRVTSSPTRQNKGFNGIIVADSHTMPDKGLKNITVAEVLMTKGEEKVGSWLWCHSNDFVYDAVKQMAQNNIGSLMVLKPGEQQLIAGIFTERDYLRKVTVQYRSSKYTKVGEVMTGQDKMITVTSDTNILQAMQLMTENHIRHAPVIDGKIVGMISIVDIVRAVVEQQHGEVKRLNEFIQGDYY
ncbi:Tubby like protein 6 [Abeliophyllum distichum]|uniref:Tubby like protein 6 n=1 Tax=Abeliophyllum distichum TaxID=126358 RepID=A0ABD1SVJ2_9LAMI